MALMLVFGAWRKFHGTRRTKRVPFPSPTLESDAQEEVTSSPASSPTRLSEISLVPMAPDEGWVEAEFLSLRTVRVIQEAGNELENEVREFKEEDAEESKAKSKASAGNCSGGTGMGGEEVDLHRKRNLEGI